MVDSVDRLACQENGCGVILERSPDRWTWANFFHTQEMKQQMSRTALEF